MSNIHNKFNKYRPMNIKWIEKDKLFSEVIKEIKPVMIGLDIGTGIMPHDYFKAVIYVCCEPYEEYAKMLAEKIKEKKYNYIILQKDWMESIEKLRDNSVDSVYLIDVIEHLEKDKGKKLLEMTEKIVRKQIIIFTPLGMVKQEVLPGGKDAWGLNGVAYQEHKSGWLPEDFDDTWDIYACKDFHTTNNINKKIDKPFGAFWAIKNFNKKDELSNSSLDSLPIEIKDALINKFPYTYFELFNNSKQNELDQLQVKYNQLELVYQNLLNSRTVRYSNKIKKYLRKIIIKKSN